MVDFARFSEDKLFLKKKTILRLGSCGFAEELLNCCWPKSQDEGKATKLPVKMYMIGNFFEFFEVHLLFVLLWMSSILICNLREVMYDPT